MQYILYCSGFDPNGFDGAFGNGVKKAVANFQNFVKLTADGVCGQQTWASLMSSAGDTTRTVTACDTRFEITDDRAKLLVKNGYKIVGRYIVGGDFKELRTGEPEVIFNNGLKFFPIFQGSGTSESDYSIETGISDAYKANLAVKKHRIPKGSTIYFAVDFDCLDYQITNSIIPYFKNVAKYFNSNYNIGIYGTRNTCRRVMAEVPRVISSFISDMSTGYSGNLGYFLPNNWNYDQIANITLNDSEYGSLEIDKVVYSGLIPAVDHLDENTSENETNEEAISVLQTLYNLSSEYKPNYDTFQKNRLVLQYLRSIYYNGFRWELTAGKIDDGFISFVESKPEYSEDVHSPKSIWLYVNEFNEKIGIQHLAASIEGIMVNGVNDSISDLAGWAGDLLTFIGELQKKHDSGTDYSDDHISSLIGGKKDLAEWTQFDIEDFIQDIDAVCIAPLLATQPIYIAFKDHYRESHARFHEFVYQRVTTSSLNSSELFEALYNIIYQYTSKNEPLTEIFTTLFYSNFDAELWKDKIARIFAQKIVDLYFKE